MHTEIVEKAEIEKGIFKNLIYSSIFQYPLTEKELFHRSEVPNLQRKDLRSSLLRMIGDGLIQEFNGFYSIDNIEDQYERRLRGNHQAEIALKKARWVAKFISLFPFVRGVFISGSLSKNYMEKESDLDFFVITEKGRLWIVKAMMVLVKKIIFLNSYKYFCVNYLVSTERLAIDERNLYTATELITVVPIFGYRYYEEFISRNQWTRKYYPNFPLHPNGMPSGKPGALKKLGEFFFTGSPGDKLDRLFMTMARRKAHSKYASKLSPKDFRIAYKSTRYTSKWHEKPYDKIIASLYEEKIKEVEMKLGLTLS